MLTTGNEENNRSIKTALQTYVLETLMTRLRAMVICKKVNTGMLF